MASTDPTVTYAGWAYKEGSLIKSWKKRFLIVKRRELAYYKSNDAASAQLMGAMRIAHAEHAPSITNGLIIYSMEGRELKIFMDTASERDKCFNAIAEWCHGNGHSAHPAHAPPSDPSIGRANPSAHVNTGAQSATLSGWLEKQGGNVPTWKRRWFVLKDGILTYSARESGPILGQHRVLGVCRDRTRPFTLELTLDTGRELRVSGSSTFEMDDWQNAIREALKDGPTGRIITEESTLNLRENLTSGAAGESWNNLFGGPVTGDAALSPRDRTENYSFGRNLRLEFDGENHSFIECDDEPVVAAPKPKPFSPKAPDEDSIRKMRLERDLCGIDDDDYTRTRVSSTDHRASDNDLSRLSKANDPPAPCCCIIT